jgi:hypothetical protein
MATIAQIRDGIATRLATISGLRVYARWPNQPNHPAAIVRVASGTFQQARVRNPIQFEITVAVEPIGDLARGQSRTDPYLDEAGSQSIKAALDGDRTLGGVADTLNVIGWRDYDGVEVNGQDYMGAIVDVEVWPSG